MALVLSNATAKGALIEQHASTATSEKSPRNGGILASCNCYRNCFDPVIAKPSEPVSSIGERHFPVLRDVYMGHGNFVEAKAGYPLARSVGAAAHGIRARAAMPR